MQYTDSLWSGLRYIWRLTPRQDAGGTNCIGGINAKGRALG